jgi:hypothetical protein
VKKVERRLIAVCIAVALVGMVVVPVAAFPGKDPFPKGYPWDTVWNMLTEVNGKVTELQGKVTDLYSKIGALTTRVTTLENKPPMHFGEWSESSYVFGTPQTAPTDGFVLADCGVGTGASSPVVIRGVTPPSFYRISVILNADNAQAGFTMPVRAGDTWVIYANGFTTDIENAKCDVRWIPLSG